MPKGGVKDFVLSLLPELGTMGSNEGEVWVTGLSTLLIYDHVSINRGLVINHAARKSGLISMPRGI